MRFDTTDVTTDQHPNLTVDPDVSPAFNAIIESLGFGSPSGSVGPSAEFFRDFVENHSDHIVLCDASGTIVYVNEAAAKGRGESREWFLGRRLSEIQEVEAEAKTAANGLNILLSLLSPEQPTITAGRWRTQKSERIFLEWVFRGIFRNGQLAALVGTARDRTAEQHALRAVGAMNKQLQESNRDLNEFAYVASHDLQEPLRKIMVFTERAKSMSGDSLDPRASDFLERSQSAARRMSQLISDLLMLSRVGTRGEAMERCDLEEVFAVVVDDLDVALSAAGAHVESGPLPTITADPTQMRQLFQNLLTNAIKFRNPSIPPIVRVTSAATPDAEGHEYWSIQFRDNGIGFAPEQGERIFTVFQRLHGRDVYEGSGIGLSVCRRITDRHGGSIVATGVPGEGATFTIVLPAQPPQDTKPSA